MATIQMVNEEQVIDYRTNLSIRGICALFVITFHWFQKDPYVSGGSAVYLVLGTFLMFSGYGLSFSLSRKEGYLDSFLNKRFASILVPFSVATVIFYWSKYRFYPICNGVSLEYSWFIMVLIACYLLFFLTFRLIKDKKMATLVLFVSIVILTIITYYPNQASYASESLLCFPFGVLLGIFNDKIVEGLKRSSLYIAVLAIIMAVLLKVLLSDFFPNVVLMNICYVLFNCALICMMKVKTAFRLLIATAGLIIYVFLLNSWLNGTPLASPFEFWIVSIVGWYSIIIISASALVVKSIFEFIGKFSYEIYISQGTIFYIITEDLQMSPRGNIYYYIPVVVLIVILGYVTYRIDRTILGRGKDVSKTNKTS